MDCNTGTRPIKRSWFHPLCLLCRVEEDEAEPLTVGGVQPIPSDEPLGCFDARQDVIREGGGGGRRPCGVYRELHRKSAGQGKSADPAERRSVQNSGSRG